MSCCCARSILLLLVSIHVHMFYLFFSSISSASALLSVRTWKPSAGSTLPPKNFVFRHTIRPVTAVKQNDIERDKPDFDSDEQLLRTVRKSQLLDLYQQCQLPLTLSVLRTKTKPELLLLLRQHAQSVVEQERVVRERRVEKVERGSSEEESKERYETVETVGYEADEDEEEDDFIFFHNADAVSVTPTTATTTTGNTQSSSAKPNKPNLSRQSRAAVTAPQPPPLHLADASTGERTVTIYSTTEENDLTGIAAAQPGYSSNAVDSLLSSKVSSGTAGTTDLPSSALFAGKASNAETERAKETIVELVDTLLSLTGMPAFSAESDENGYVVNHNQPLGFDPAKVPVHLLSMAVSHALRTGRGAVLQDVMRQYEIQAIGHDGRNGDNIEKNGGHYRQVQKVRAFLEGYRRAEVRRLARETTSMLLDRLVTDGVQGLDMALASMVRSSDDTTEHGGDSMELNDSLVDFLNDAVRQQEKKVGDTTSRNTLMTANYGVDEKNNVVNGEDDDDIDDDLMDRFWNVTVEDGQRVEILDPNHPNIRLLQQTDLMEKNDRRKLPVSPSEQLLLVLKLLRDRIKAEAAFSFDEKGRNLRLLAYCLRLSSIAEREQLLLKDLGSSLDRLDSFIELAKSSIEYGESTSYQLKPTKQNPLNLKQLKSILALAQNMREQQAWRASGAR